MSRDEAGERGSRVVRGDGGEGVCGGGSEFRYGLKHVGGVGSGASEVLVDHVLEVLDHTWLDVQLPVTSRAPSG